MRVDPIHPGEILREEYLKPLGISAGALAKRLRVPRTRIERLATEQSPVTVDTALRLSAALGTTPEFWLRMQSAFDIERERILLSTELDEITAALPKP